MNTCNNTDYATTRYIIINTYSSFGSSDANSSVWNNFQNIVSAQPVRARGIPAKPVCSVLGCSASASAGRLGHRNELCYSKPASLAHKPVRLPDQTIEPK